MRYEIRQWLAVWGDTFSRLKRLWEELDESSGHGGSQSSLLYIPVCIVRGARCCCCLKDSCLKDSCLRGRQWTDWVAVGSDTSSHPSSIRHPSGYDVTGANKIKAVNVLFSNSHVGEQKFQDCKNIIAVPSRLALPVYIQGNPQQEPRNRYPVSLRYICQNIEIKWKPNQAQNGRWLARSLSVFVCRPYWIAETCSPPYPSR